MVEKSGHVQERSEPVLLGRPFRERDGRHFDDNDAGNADRDIFYSDRGLLIPAKLRL